MSPSSYMKPGPEPGTNSHFHAQESDVNRGSEPCQSGTARTFPVTWTIGAVQVHAHDDHITLSVQNLINSLLTEIIIPQT